MLDYLQNVLTVYNWKYLKSDISRYNLQKNIHCTDLLHFYWMRELLFLTPNEQFSFEMGIL